MSERSNIYYWKCDRPAPFHAIASAQPASEIEPLLLAELRTHFQEPALTLRPGSGQGNHLTWVTEIGNEPVFIRAEDGPERDDYMEVESHVLGEVASSGVPTPRVLASDATRTRVPFAWQVLERIPHPDLNQHFKNGALEFDKIAFQIGTAIARWQCIQPSGFGPFSLEALRTQGKLTGLHTSYEDYFLLNLDRHLHFLVERQFITQAYANEIRSVIDEHRSLLQLQQGCLVHKDLALWNILGSPDQIAAFIDFDDTIAGAPMDDLSLLACFHDAQIIAQALAGYQTIRPLPSDHQRRLSLHLLRNMLVKAVIRVGAGYFDRDGSFFLVSSNGPSLKEVTLAKLKAAISLLAEA